MIRNRKLMGFVIVSVLSIFLLFLLSLPREQKPDVFELMKNAYGIRLEQKDDFGVLTQEINTSNLLNSGFSGLRIHAVEKEVDQTQWNYRITFNYGLPEDDPTRVIFLVGDGWIVINETTYEFENEEQWDGFEDSLENEFAKYLPKDAVD